jgi:hypothetical protein
MESLGKAGGRHRYMTGGSDRVWSLLTMNDVERPPLAPHRPSSRCAPVCAEAMGIPIGYLLDSPL